jgi:hypothetical protein
MPKIFVSHRRDDTGNLVHNLVNQLKTIIGNDNVILDDYVLRGEGTFRHRLIQDIVSSDAFMILIGKNWLSKQPNGIPWVYRENSWTRFEIRVALLFKKTVVL